MCFAPKDMFKTHVQTFGKSECPKNPEILDLHHIIPKKDGGPDKLTNLILLHSHCHYETHYAKLTS